MQLEKRMEELNTLVEKLEAPATTLDEGIQLYERSLAITRETVEELKAAKNKITEIKLEMDKILSRDAD